MFYTPRVGVEYREEPCRSALNRVKGMGFRLVAEPVHGLRAPLHVLLRPRLRAPRRPAVRRPLRALDPRQGQRRRGAAPRARAAVVGGRDRRDRRCHRPVPARRGSLPAHARMPRGAARHLEPVQPDHAQPDDRPRPRRARRRGEAEPRSASSSRCRRSTRTSGGAPSRGRRRRSAASMRFGDSSTRGSRRASEWRRSFRASPTGRTSSSGSSAPRARPARRASGRTSSISGPARVSTSSRRWPATGRRSWSATSGSTANRAYLPRKLGEPDPALVAELRAKHGIRDRRRVKLRPEPRPEQLHAPSE